MKKFILIAVLMLVLNSSSVMGIEAAGTAFGTTTTAKVIGAGNGNFGMVAGIADATTFGGTFTYGMSNYIDGRVKLGLISANSNTDIVFGADLKYQIWSVSDAAAKPFDMSLGGLLEYTSGDHYSILHLGGFVLGSYPFQLNNGSFLTPYARFNLRLENFSADDGGSSSELEFGINGGVSYDLSKNMTAYGEFQIDGNDGVFFGLDFRVL
ncbi:MAG: hypothetical protein ABIJ12_14510 [bacterium]